MPAHRLTAHHLAVLPIDSQQNGQRNTVGQDAAAAEAHERQGKALGRQDAHVHAHVDQRLHADPYRDTLCNQRREGALQIDCLPAHGKRAQHQPGEQQHDQRHADQPELFGNHRQ